MKRQQTPAEPQGDDDRLVVNGVRRRAERRERLQPAAAAYENAITARAATMAHTAKQHLDGGNVAEAAVLLRLSQEFAALAEELRWWD